MRQDITADLPLFALDDLYVCFHTFLCIRASKEVAYVCIGVQAAELTGKIHISSNVI
jgi:hypothetical protein